ncbi:hypothetical protein N7512_001815, partial [Penicillium capsulatum]
MGTEYTATVYAAQLRGTEMAMEIVWRKLNSHGKPLDRRSVTVFTDSLVAPKAMIKLKMPSGQIFLPHMLYVLRKLEEQGACVEFRWIPAHSGIDAAAKRQVRANSKAEWETTWRQTKTARRIKRIIEMPTKKVLDYWRGLRKATTSVMIQLRTGKIGLAGYLAKIKARESPRCVCGFGFETLEHVLYCDRWVDERNDMKLALLAKNTPMMIAASVDELLTHEGPAKAVANFDANRPY